MKIHSLAAVFAMLILAVTPAALRQTMEDWQVKEHTVTSGDLDTDLDVVVVEIGTLRFLAWAQNLTQDQDLFQEVDNNAGKWSYVIDDKNAGVDSDVVGYQLGSPSQPMSEYELRGDSLGDDGFVDVDFAPGV